MRIEAWDHGFVRAHRRDIHRVLADVAAYGAWWPGVHSRALGSSYELVLRAPVGLRRRRRLLLTVTKDRPGLGLRFDLGGDIEGSGEWFYLDEPNGVMVHALLKGSPAGRGASTMLRDYRWCVRSAFHTLKDLLEGDRLAGDEPDPAFLQRQEAAIREFRAGVEAHERRIAAEGGGG
jgi:hypothetical protein